MGRARAWAAHAAVLALLATCTPGPGTSPTVPAPTATVQPGTATQAAPTTVATDLAEAAAATPQLKPTLRGAGWEQVVPREAARPPARELGTLVHDPAAKRLYLFGGRAQGSALGDLWSFDLATRTWKQVDAAGPAPRWGHVAAFDAPRGRIVVFSGQSSTGFFDDTWTFDTQSQRWAEISGSERPPARYGSCAGVDAANGAMYISHGFTHSGRFDDTWRLDLATLSWSDLSPKTGERPIKRCLHQCAFFPEGDSLYLFGGQSNQAPFLGDLWRFDVNMRMWEPALSATAQRPDARHFSAVAAAGEGLLVFGGLSASGKLSDSWRFIPGRGWLPVTVPGPAARSGHMAAWVSDENALYVWGGAGASGVMDDLWRLDR